MISKVAIRSSLNVTLSPISKTHTLDLRNSSAILAIIAISMTKLNGMIVAPRATQNPKSTPTLTP